MSTATTFEEKLAQAVQKEFESGNGAIQEMNGESGLDFSSPPPTEEKKEEKVAEEKKIETPEAKAEGEQKIETPVEEKPTESSLTQKSLDELLSEKSEGKFKSWDDIEKTITAPKEYKSKFAEKLEQYVAEGGDEETYFATQSINFDKMSATELMEYKIQAEDPDMSQEEINYEMKKRYGIDQWKNKADDYEDGVEPEEIKMAKLRFEREANKARTQFKEHQQKWAVAPSKEDKTAEAQKNLEAIKEWDNKAREAVTKLDKVALKLSDTETYDYAVDDAERSEIQKAVSQLRVDARTFWDSYKQKDGSYDMKGIADAMFKVRNFEKAVKLAADQASKKGAKAIVKDLKNSTLKSEEIKPDSNDRPLSADQQLAKAFADSVKPK